MIKKTVAAAVALAAFSALGYAQHEGKKPAAHAFQIKDDSFSYQYSSWMRDPFTTKVDDTSKAQNIVKHIVDYNHVDIGSKFGDNVYNVQYLISSRANPVSTDFFAGNTQNGAKDVYMTYRHNIPFNRLFNTKKFEFGPVKDVYGWFGFDYGTKSDAWENQRRSPMVGIGAAIKVPNKGFWNIGAGWTREWNEEGTDITSYSNPANWDWSAGYYYIAKPNSWGQPILYDHEATLNTSWSVPFSLGKAFMSFEGWGVLNSAKGYGACNLKVASVSATKTFGKYNTDATTHASDTYTTECHYAGSKPEAIIRPQVMFNFGKLIGPSHNWQIGAGWEYWNNMYGVDHKVHGTPDSTSIESAPFFALTIHL